MAQDLSYFLDPINWTKPEKRKLSKSVSLRFKQIINTIVIEYKEASKRPLNLIRWPTEDKLIFSIGELIINGEQMNSFLDDCHLDHVAIAVENIEESVSLYSNLGLEFNEEREIVESQKVKTAFCPIDNRANIELLEPTSEDSNIAKFIKKNGPGIHHLCFRVKDVKEKQKELSEKGVRFIYDEPFIGAHNCLVNFIHPKSMGGVLVEISQKMQG